VTSTQSTINDIKPGLAGLYVFWRYQIAADDQQVTLTGYFRPIAVIGAAIIAGNLMTASANKGVFHQPSTGQEVLYKCEDWHFPEYVTMTMRYFPS
jgi:hypothetical protein